MLELTAERWQGQESFISRLRDQRLNGELFVGMAEARYLIKRWRVECNTVRPHSSLGYSTPQEFAASCAPFDSASLHIRAHGPRSPLAAAAACSTN